MKNQLALFIIKILFLVVFNSLFFTLGGTEHTDSVWISYGTIHIAYLFILLMPLFNKGNEGQANLTASLYSIAISYFLLELIVGCVFIYLKQEDIIWSLSTQLVLFALFLIILLASYIANNHTVESIKEERKNASWIKNASIKLQVILEKVSDPEVKRVVEKCYDSIQASPIKTHQDVQNTELIIRHDIEELYSNIENLEKDSIIQICKSVILKIEERNKTLRVINKLNN